MTESIYLSEYSLENSKLIILSEISRYLSTLEGFIFSLPSPPFPTPVVHLGLRSKQIHGWGASTPFQPNVKTPRFKVGRYA